MKKNNIFNKLFNKLFTMRMIIRVCEILRILVNGFLRMRKNFVSTFIFYCLLGIPFFFVARALYDYSPERAHACSVLFGQANQEIDSRIGGESEFSNDTRTAIKRVLFSPDDNPESVLLGLIEAETQKILVATYSFTNSNLAQALAEAKKRGVKIEIVADGSNAVSDYSKISYLKSQKIPIWIYQSLPYTTRARFYSQNNNFENRVDDKAANIGIMHHKFMIFKKTLGGSILWTGSYNFTRSANSKNQENVIILNDIAVIDRYAKQFELLKQRCKKLSV